MRLVGKVALITGAASGIGRAAAELFARQGARVILADLNAEGGEDAAHAASAAGNACLFRKTDVSSEDDIRAAIYLALGEFGRLDITFNNAGFGGAMGAIEDVSVDAWEKTQAVLLRGVFLGIKHSVQPMREVGGGSIVSTASIAGIEALPNEHAYCAAKAGVISLTRSAAMELGSDFIRVNCIAPGAISTPLVWAAVGSDKKQTDTWFKGLQPLPRAGQPDEVAKAALFLASDDASFITGHTLVVDGGMTIGSVPGNRFGEKRVRSEPQFAGPSYEMPKGQSPLSEYL